MLNSDYTCSLPSKYLIEPGNICNLKCPFCATGAGIPGVPRGMMTLDNFKLILKKIAPYAKIIGLYNFGEPFLNKDIIKMISLAAELESNVILSTNLSLPNIDHEAVVNSGLKSMIVSIDGASQETYGKYRRGGSYDIVINNIKRIEAIKKSVNKKTPKIDWQFLINKFNEHEVGKARQMANELGIEFFCSYMYVWDKSWEAPSNKHNTNIEHSVAKSDRVKYEKTDRSLPTSLDRMALHPDTYIACRQPFDTLTIEWNGNVYPCCASYDNNAVLGNILTTGPEEIWNNKMFRACREYLYNYKYGVKTDAVCATVNCIMRDNYCVV